MDEQQIETSLNVIRGYLIAYKATKKESYKLKGLSCLDLLKWELRRYKYEKRAL